MILRKATVMDVNTHLLDLYVEGFNMHYEARKDIFFNITKEDLKSNLIEMINSTLEVVMVLEDNNEVIGYLAYQYKIKATKSLWIDELIIDSKYRSKGYGKKVFENIERIALENSCARVELNCWSFNEKALKFYETIGFDFQRVILEKDVDDNGSICME